MLSVCIFHRILIFIASEMAGNPGAGTEEEGRCETYWVRRCLLYDYIYSFIDQMTEGHLINNQTFL